MKRIWKYILFDTVMMGSLYVIASVFLSQQGLEFRPWVMMVFVVLLGAGFLAGVTQLILRIKNKKTGMALLAALLLLSGLIAPQLITYLAFAHTPEHVAEREGKKYVAHVITFLDVYVKYHEHVNLLVEGKPVLIEEYYGEGSFDPLRGEGETEPRYTVYYDEEGNVVRAIGVRF